MVKTPYSTSGQWIPPGERAAAGGHVIPGGLIYLGRHLTAESGSIEPALINPDLPVAVSVGRVVVPAGGPELAYHLLSPAARTAYLVWLAGGRRSDVPPGLVLLFCFGLERRVLLDGDDDPAVHRELPLLTAEARRLRVRYDDGGPALRSTLDHLIDLLELLTAARAPAPAPGRTTTMAVRIALARFAAASAPVPAGWARAWLRHHPSLTPRSSEIDCPAEFDRLFALRYPDRFGRGLVPPGGGAGIRLRYRPASPGLSMALVCREDLPDTFLEPRSTRALSALRDEVAAALDPYRRWLARFPQGRDSLAAAALLPAELVEAHHGKLGAVRVWAERQLDGLPRTMVDAGEFWAFWSTAAPERMAAEEASAFLAVLALLDFGVEPDVRFGAPALTPGPATLFRLGRPAAGRPSARFPAAAAIARCAAAVASAARPVDPQGPIGAAVLATTADLAAALRLTPGEDLRLAARLGWLLTTRVEVDRLSRQTTTVTADEREIAGHYLITVALAADPVIGPAAVAVLTRLYRVLGLQPDLVFQRLHERSVGGAPTPARPVPVARSGDSRQHGHGHGNVPAAPDEAAEADEPVVVQASGSGASGYALPWAVPATLAAPMPPEASGAGAGVRLDPAVIEQKVAESSIAATLLSSIFESDQPPDDGQAHPVPGLDPAHGALLHALAARPSWTWEEFASLASARGLLPAGALDLLNEVAIDTAGAPLVEGDVILTVSNDVLLELLS